MPTMRDVVVSLGFDVNSEPLKKFEASITQAKVGALALGGVIAGAATTIFGFAKAAAHQGDQAIKAAQRTGIHAESLQRLQYAARLADVSNEELEQGLRFLNKNLMDAAKGGDEAQIKFEQMGISLRDSHGVIKATDKLLLELSGKFAALPEGGAKAALAQEIFGRSGSRLLPFLNQGPKGIQKLSEEAEEFGLVLSHVAAEQGEQFNDQLTRLAAIGQGLAVSIGQKLLPVIIALTDEIIDFYKANKKELIEAIGDFMTGLGKSLKIAFSYAKALATAFVGVVRAFGGFAVVMPKVLAGLAAMGLFFAMSSIGNMVMGIGALITAFQALTAAELAANLMAVALPALIGLAVVAVGLLLEDMYAFFSGKDSVFGLLNDKFNQLGEVAQAAIYVILAPVRVLMMMLQGLAGLLDVVMGKNPSFGDINKRMLDTFMGTGGGLNGALGLPSAQSAPVAPGSGNASTTNQQNTFNINVPAGTDPSMVGDKVESGVAKGMDNTLRHANYSLRAGMEY